MTDFLQLAVEKADLYKIVVPRLEHALGKASATRIVDLCSGGGGPWGRLMQSVGPLRRRETEVCLTDMYINLPALQRLKKASEGRLDFHGTPVDAKNVPATLGGFRTLFSSFHHFDNEDAKSILQDAIEKSQGIAIFESTQRHPLMLLYMLFTPILVILSFPIIRPFSWSRLFWTCVLPVIPLAVMIDGLVSCIRTYTTDELEGLVAQVDGSDRFRWEIGVERFEGLPVGVTYLIGLRQ